MRHGAQGVPGSPGVEPGDHPALAAIEEVGASLQRSVAATVRHVAGRHARPSRLGPILDVSVPVASRLLSVVRADDPVSAVLASPGVRALRRIAQRAHELAAPASAVATLSDAIDAFDRLIRDTPGGRAGIETAASRHSPVARHGAEAKLRAGAFKTSAELLGRRCAVQSCTFLYTRRGLHSTNIWADRITGLSIDDDAPVLRFDFHTVPPRAFSGGNGARLGAPLTLDGRVPDTPADYLLDASSDYAGSRVSVEAKEHKDAFVLDVRPPAGVATDLSLACLRHREGPFRFESTPPEVAGNFYSVLVPTEELVMDVVFGGDIRVPPPPRPYTHLVSHLGPVNSGEVDDRPERVNLIETIEALGPGTESFAHPRLNDQPGFLDRLCHAVDLDPKTVRGYRLRNAHPLLATQVTLCYHPDDRMTATEPSLDDPAVHP
ncbi:MAG: hypothetical protein AAGG07_13740 [Planctomycetota bacterium]